eukprot:gnl/TRDRNA2_/TRDRNA2_183071_c0_seq1.p1 gnl/TRDRNA2_/TRDRNA2_183071_c0~~gnl/TRDRNA2_/TRDRNA2_183071_c0_seq1.p1  ORF type:complete len:643 (+),score=146.74 gnl/TRDRNA2_/TRDRNA2_183071_c0_seq1:118-2046(+)
MEFLAATKDGIIIYDFLDVSETGHTEEGRWAEGFGNDGLQAKVIASIQSPPNAFGFCWSHDGKMLASVCQDGTRIYDAPAAYKILLELPKVAPDEIAREAVVRNVKFSTAGNYLVCYEKWDPQYPINVHVWGVTGKNAGNKLHSLCLKQYTSGSLPCEMIQWTVNDTTCLELVPGRGVKIWDGDLSSKDEDAKEVMIAEKNCAHFAISPVETKGACYVACSVPEINNRVAKVSVYHLSDPNKATINVDLPAKVKDTKLLWNAEGSIVLALATSDVDETGSSYFGSSSLYWIRADGKGQMQIYGAADGLVQDLAWAPTTNEFMVIVGMLPATVALHDGKTGKQTSKLGESRRNTIKWNKFGRFVTVGGFGALPGDLDIFDRSCQETVSSFRAPIAVDTAWGPDGRHFLTCTVAPRMNEANQITIYKYTGDKKLKIDFAPAVKAARHEDTGAGARTKTAAYLFAASWRPFPGQYEDQPATPRPANAPKRPKGLPDQTPGAAGPAPKAWAARGGYGGGDSGAVAAMMRGEISMPEAKPVDRWDNGEAKEAKPLEEWEIRKMQREAQKAAELKAQQAKEAEKQLVRDAEQAYKDKKKRIKQIKEQLEKLDEIKEKDWDELTPEDEEELEEEVALRTELAELEKGKS